MELLTPLFVSLGGAVLAMLAIGALARAWASRTADRGGLGPFLAARRLVRRQDLAQLVLPLLLATAMATFAASAWQVADDWRVSRAAASVGADTLYRTEASPTRLMWASRRADPDGRYFAAALPPIQRPPTAAGGPGRRGAVRRRHRVGRGVGRRVPRRRPGLAARRPAARPGDVQRTVADRRGDRHRPPGRA